MNAISIVCADRRITLAAGQTITVGRGLDCDVILTDGAASRRHVQVTNKGGRALLRDLGSLNGTWVAGCRIDGPTLLSPGQQAVVGGTSGVPLRVERATTPVAPPAPPTSRLSTATDGVITIGRGLGNRIVVDDLLVSRRHARLVPHRRHGYLVTDLDSRNGTYINGRRIESGHLSEGDLLTVGHSRFGLRSGRLVASIDKGDVDLAVDRLGYTTADGQVLLDDVSFTLDGAGLLAVVGPSGAGKTTLLRALTGARPATTGTVWYDGRDLYENFDDLRHRVGVVPQEDVVHTRLTVREALRFAAELRFPDDLDPSLREGRVEEVLAELGLTAQADTRVDRLSGGQRKRTSVALELLTRPSVLYLDEPTSGLDPGLDKQVMHTLRELADGGRTVVVITHNVANLGLCDKVLVLAPGGKVAYVGAPAALLPFFGVTDWADVFTQVAQDPDGVHRRFRDSVLSDRRRADRPVVPRHREEPLDRPPRQQSIPAQLSTLVRRHTRVILADKGYAAFIVLLPVGLALLAIVMPGHSGLSAPLPGRATTIGSARTLLLVLVVGAIFMGTTASIRELVGERAIFERERAVGLSATAYLCSKLAVFGIIGLVQSAVLVLLVRVVKPPAAHALVFGAPTLELIVICWVTAFCATSLGLLLSSLATTSEQVMPMLVGTVMAQLVLCGGLFTLEGGLRAIAAIVPGRWNFAAGAASVDLPGMMRTQGMALEPDVLWRHTTGVFVLDLAAAPAFVVLYAVITHWRLGRPRD